MLLYRYLPEQYALEALQTGSLKVSRLLELNDPADCQPRLADAPAQGSRDADEAFARNYLQTLYRDVGMLSFSASISDPVIWSHYADSHRGIALGYDIRPDLGGVQIFEVSYHIDRPTIDYQQAEALRPDGERSTEFIEKVIKHGFTCKGESWRYEKEYRSFVWLAKCEMRGSHYFNTHMRGFPDQIVLGLKCRLTEFDVIRAAKVMHRSDVRSKIKRAKLHQERHVIETENCFRFS
jgi:hypothetical protein